MIGVEASGRTRSEQSELYKKLFDGDILLIFDDKTQDLFR